MFTTKGKYFHFFSLSQFSQHRKSVSGHVKTDDISSLEMLCRVLRRIQNNDCEEGAGGMFMKEQGDMLVDAVLLLLHCLKDYFSRLVSTSTVSQVPVVNLKLTNNANINLLCM